MPSVASANEAPNQRPLAMQLRVPILLQQDPARIPGILPAPIPPKSLII